MIDKKSMTDTFFAAMGGISPHHLEDCERVRTAGLPKKQEPLLLRIMEPIGVVAMVAAVLAVLIVAPDFLKEEDKRSIIQPRDTAEYRQHIAHLCRYRRRSAHNKTDGI